MATTIPSLESPIDTYLQCCTAEGKSTKTIEWYEANLKRFSQFLKNEHLHSSVFLVYLTCLMGVRGKYGSTQHFG